MKKNSYAGMILFVDATTPAYQFYKKEGFIQVSEFAVQGNLHYWMKKEISSIT